MVDLKLLCVLLGVGLAAGAEQGSVPAVSQATSTQEAQRDGDPHGGAECLSWMRSYELSEPLDVASDVRWVNQSTVLIANPLRGVARVRLAEEAEIDRFEVRRGHGPGGFFLPVYLGASDTFLAVAAPVHVVGWRRWLEPTLQESAMNAVLDLDLRADRLLILGAQSDDRGFAPDGAIAFTASLSDQPFQPRPLHYSSTGAGARAIDRCGLMEIGAARLLVDGSAVIVPGAEPGVFQFNREGRMVKSWQAETLGFDAGCDLTEQEAVQFSANETARWGWVNRRRIVDDVLPMPDGAGLLVRSVRGGEASWTLKVLRGDGIRSCPIPVQAGSEFFLHGDVDEDRVVLLLHPRVEPSELGKPSSPRPKLIIMRYRP